MNKRTKRRAFLVPGVILAGIAIMVILIISRRPPEHQGRPPTGALVEVVEAKRTNQEVIVTAYGSVQALYTVNVIPQVNGKVEWVSPNLVAGGMFEQGEPMLRIEQDDYELRVQQARAQVAQAEYQLQLAQAQAAIAEREWEMVSRNRARQIDSNPPGVENPPNGSSNEDVVEQPDPLVLHEPQLRQAEASLQSAQAALEQAQLNLKRTVIRAPFNARVRSKNVAPSQLVGPGSPVANIYNTDVAEIEVNLPLADIAYMEVPGAPVDIILETGRGHHMYSGFVDRQVGVIEQTGRLAQVIVRVEDPYRSQGPDKPGLVLGAFVETRIHGKVAEDVIVVPRGALRQNDKVWIAAEDSTLSIRTVDIYYRNRDNVLVSDGVEDGDMIILTPITGAAEGMELRPEPLDEPADNPDSDQGTGS